MRFLPNGGDRATLSYRNDSLLDRYIVRQFLATAFFSLIAFTIIFVVIDAMERLDDFIDHDATILLVARYYLFFVPEIIKLITPVAMLLGSLFVTARLSTQNEITAMKTGGISLYRMMVPYVGVAVVVSALSIYFNGWIVPQANKMNSPSSATISRRMSFQDQGQISTS
jgi:lipopolysaccharide export system permease protein